MLVLGIRGLFGRTAVARGALQVSRFSVTKRQPPRVFQGKVGGESADKLFKSAMMLLDREEYTDAIRLFDEGLALDPSDGRAFAGRASCFERTGELEKAEKDYRKVVALMPDSPPAHVALAECLRQMGRMEEAERQLDLLLSSIGEYVPALLVKGEIQLDDRRAGSALDTFGQALKKDPTETFAMSGMGQAWLQMGQLEDAEKMIRRVLKLTDENAQDWSNLGTVLYQQNELEEALDCFSRAIQITGEPEFHIQRAACLFAQKDAKEALLDLKHVESMNVEGARHILDLMMGSAYYTIGEKDVAGPYFRDWLDDLSPNEDPDQVLMIRLKCAECFAAVDASFAKSLLDSASKMEQSATDEFKTERDEILKKMKD